ncbi:MAG: cysteate synthase [Bacteroidales bacterium]
MTNYKLQNVATGRVFEDSGWLLSDPLDNNPSLIRAIYSNRQLNLKESSLGLFRYSDWLPVKRSLKGSGDTITYHSKRLGTHLGLENLYISFSGYWPQIGAAMESCSFKETEAYSVCGRLEKDNNDVLVVASAGNTARAFARVCSDNNIPLLVVIPYDNLDAMWFKEPIGNCVKIISTPTGSDYFDAIELANRICGHEGFFEEGGAKNVARRDGMGTTVLSAVTTIGEIPQYYFQAIGSGTGTIAAWEANLRFLEDGRYGDRKMKLIPSQNRPFTPIYDAYRNGSRHITFKSEDEARKEALEIDAKVLSNRRPPYGISGGLFDALKDSNGDVEAVDNVELREAAALFKKLEGIDIHPASGVALAGMIKSIERLNIKRDSLIMLNITGGGEELFKSHNRLHYLQPNMVIESTQLTDSKAQEIRSFY